MSEPTPRKPLAAIPRPTKELRSKPYSCISLENSGFVGEGKTVLITGGATGVGFAIATAFAKARVKRIIIISRSPGPQEKAKTTLESQFPSVEVLTISASITDYEQIVEILQELHNKYGIDILVHSAVTVGDATPVEQLSMKMVQDAFTTNVFAALNLFQAYGGLKHQSVKTIINVSSAAAGMMFPLNSIYGASKAATAHIVQHLSIEQAQKPENERMRIFSFHPGQFFTPLVSSFVEEDWVDWDDIELPGDYAVWLAGPHSDFLQGRFTWATWDMEELLTMKDKIAKDPYYLTIGLNL